MNYTIIIYNYKFTVQICHSFADQNVFFLTNQRLHQVFFVEKMAGNLLHLEICLARRSQEELEIFKGRLTELNQQVKTLGDENSCSAMTWALGVERF